MNKDFKLILEKANELGAPMPVTAAALQINAARTSRSPDEDFSSVIAEMERLARVSEDSQPAGLRSKPKIQATR